MDFSPAAIAQRLRKPFWKCLLSLIPSSFNSANIHIVYKESFMLDQGNTDTLGTQSLSQSGLSGREGGKKIVWHNRL